MMTPTVTISEAAKRLGVKPKQIKVWLEEGLLEGTRELTKAKRARLERLGLVSGFSEHADKWRIERDAIISFRQKHPHLLCPKGKGTGAPFPVLEEKPRERRKEVGRPDIIDHIEEICDTNGAIAEVGPAYYESFSNLSSKHMRALIRVLIANGGDDLRNLAAGPGGAGRICKQVERNLSLISWGIMQIDCFGSPAFFKRVGPDATDNEKAKMAARLESAKRDVGEVVNDLLPYLLPSPAKQIEMDIQ